MANRLNLAMLNKKKEEVSKNELNKAKGGTVQLNTEASCSACNPYLDTYATVYTGVTGVGGCKCSIWMIFGIAWGVSVD